LSAAQLSKKRDRSVLYLERDLGREQSVAGYLYDRFDLCGIGTDNSQRSAAISGTAIERVLVYEGGNIEIVMKYQDVFKLTRDYVMEIQGKRENTDEGTEDSNLYQVVNG